MSNSVRVRMSRESTDDEDAKETSFTLCVHVLVEGGLSDYRNMDTA